MYHLVLQYITMYYKVRLGIARCDKAGFFVVCDMGGASLVYYTVFECTRMYDLVLQRITLYYEVRRGTTKFDFVLRSQTLY